MGSRHTGALAAVLLATLFLAASSVAGYPVDLPQFDTPLRWSSDGTRLAFLRIFPNTCSVQESLQILDVRTLKVEAGPELQAFAESVSPDLEWVAANDAMASTVIVSRVDGTGALVVGKTSG